MGRYLSRLNAILSAEAKAVKSAKHSMTVIENSPEEGLVSIVVAFLNAERFIAETIES